MLLEDSWNNEYLDNAHYDIAVRVIPRDYAKLDDIVVTSASGLNPFVLADGNLKTQEFTLTCIVTAEQDQLLQKLYGATVHPAFIDLRYPVEVSWGPAQAKIQRTCYLKAYAPPSQVHYDNPSILEVTLTLRVIRK